MTGNIGDDIHDKAAIDANCESQTEPDHDHAFHFADLVPEDDRNYHRNEQKVWSEEGKGSMRDVGCDHESNTVSQTCSNEEHERYARFRDDIRVQICENPEDRRANCNAGKTDRPCLRLAAMTLTEAPRMLKPSPSIPTRRNTCLS